MIKINGENIQADGMTVFEYLNNHGYDLKRVAVELNGEILPKKSYESTIFAGGDQVEIVTFVGGG